MIVREATAEDLHDLWEMRQHLQCEEAEKEPSLQEGYTQRTTLLTLHQILGRLVDGNSTVLIVESNGHSVGYAIYVRSSMLGLTDRRVGTVASVYVKPAYRRTKALFLLYRQVLDLSESEGDVALQGMVLWENPEVVRIWERRGARVVGIILEMKTEVDHGIRNQTTAVCEGIRGSCDPDDSAEPGEHPR